MTPAVWTNRGSSTRPRRRRSAAGNFVQDAGPGRCCNGAMPSPPLRPCRDDDQGAILAIVNAAAEAYRGVIPADCWHEPYMGAAELAREIAAGVRFSGYEV